MENNRKGHFECKDETLVFTNFTSLVFIPTMIALLVILFIMSETYSKESNIPALSHIGSSVERHSSVVDNVCDARQHKPGLIPSRVELVAAALPESLLQGVSINLQSALPFS